MGDQMGEEKVMDKGQVKGKRESQRGDGHSFSALVQPCLLGSPVYFLI